MDSPSSSPPPSPPPSPPVPQNQSTNENLTTSPPPSPPVPQNQSTNQNLTNGSGIPLDSPETPRGPQAFRTMPNQASPKMAAGRRAPSKLPVLRALLKSSNDANNRDNRANNRDNRANNRDNWRNNERDSEDSAMRTSSSSTMAPRNDPPKLPTLRKEEEWKQWGEIIIRVGPGLPIQFTTLDMYHMFMGFGDLESVELFESPPGKRDGSGKVKFTRVLGNFWDEPLKYQWGNTYKEVKLALEKPKRSFKVTSPVNPEIFYHEKFNFKPKLLEFGFMHQPDVMMSMFTTKPTDEISFEVNLFRRCIDVTFRIYLSEADLPQSTSSAASTASGQGSDEEDEEDEEEEEEEQSGLDRHEHYRFRISFAHLGKFYKKPTADDPSRFDLIIPLPSPPLFWRKLHNIARSHDLNGTYWCALDVWFRQTSITYNPRLKHYEPITLKQARPVIDTGRWTTYRFTFDLRESEIPKFDEMISALGDFNVETGIYKDFKVNKDQLPPVWDWIDANPSQRDLFWPSGTPALTYPVRYQLEVCISQNCFSEYNLTPEFIKRLAELPESKALALLEHVAERKTRIFDTMTIFSLTGIKGKTVGAKIPSYCQILRKAVITPSMVYFSTPTVEFTNRVVRHFAEHAHRFLRVQFMDENVQGRINSTDKMTMHEIFSRVKHALDNGIKIGDLHFEFLAFGNSQIRDHGAYFFAPTEHVSAATIRGWMGEFKEIRVVAKHAARLGQCFSSTRAITGVKVDVCEIDDIEHNGYCFSDGVGKLSEFLAQLISSELKLPQDKPPPSCFQFRLGGCKGVLTVSPDAKQREVHIRPSQRKFKTNHTSLEVVRWSQYAGASLNRQLIIILSSLGIDDNVFIYKQLTMMRNFKQAMEDATVALPLLCKTIDPNQSTLAIAGMIRDGFMERNEPFLTSLLRLWRAWSIKYLKEKAKINIEEGAFVLGVVDETGKLRGYMEDEEDVKNDKKSPRPLPEIFLQISDPDHPGEFRIIEDICIIARNPSLHPGDIRTVRAVDVPELHHLRDVVVFPQTGKRDLPSMLSGGDLDGDDYIVIWDKDLTYKVLDYPPMDYTPLKPYELDRDVEVNDITTFFVNYMKSDKLGTIASAHLAWADKAEDGVMYDKCIQLAVEHSKAVDYVKTGEPAQMRRSLRPKSYPHFMERPEEKSYQSCKILGKLYDEVEKVDFVPSFETEFDNRILNAYTIDENILEAVRDIKSEYDSAMNRIMAQHEVNSEFEVYTTFVLQHSTATKDYKFHEDMGNISNSLRDRFRKIVYEKFDIHDQESLGPVVAAMYTVTHQELVKARQRVLNRKLRFHASNPTALKKEDIKDMPLLSFPWLFRDILGKIANRRYPFTHCGNGACKENGIGGMDGTNGDHIIEEDDGKFEIIPEVFEERPSPRTSNKSPTDTSLAKDGKTHDVGVVSAEQMNGIDGDHKIEGGDDDDLKIVPEILEERPSPRSHQSSTDASLAEDEKTRDVGVSAESVKDLMGLAFD